MKLTRLERIYAALLLIVMAGIIVHAPLSVGFGTLLPHYSLLIKSWKEILLFVAALLSLIIVTRRHLWRELSQEWVLRIGVLYVLIHLLMAAILFQGSAPTVAGLLIDLRFVGYLILIYILMKIAPWYRLRLVIAAAFGAMIAMTFGVLQLFLPADILSHIGYSRDTIAPYLTVDKNPNYIRINSTLRGPNPLGAYAVMVLGMMASIVTRQRFRLKRSGRLWGFIAMAVASVVVLWVSYSRSALIAAIVTCVAVVLAAYGRRLSRRVWISAGVIALVLFGGVLLGRHTSFVENVILHDNPGTGAAVTSNDGHVSSLVSGVQRLLHQPFGGGVGSTGSASLLGGNSNIVENQYLFVAHEAGWLGLLVFLWLYGFMLWRFYQDRRDWLSLGLFASGIGLAVIGVLLPVWADDTVSLVWWGLAGVALGTRKGNRHERTTGK